MKIQDAIQKLLDRRDAARHARAALCAHVSELCRGSQGPDRRYCSLMTARCPAGEHLHAVLERAEADFPTLDEFERALREVSHVVRAAENLRDVGNASAVHLVYQAVDEVRTTMGKVR